MYNQCIILGIVLSILFSELVGLSPAGLIVPGYFALALRSPLRIAYTLAIAIAAMAVCRLLGKVMILYGRRQFAVTILAAFLLDALLTSSGLFPWDVNLIGCLIPGIIARDLDRQGIVKTLLSLAVVTGILLLIALLLGWPILSL